jgi:hypothetical protein
MPFTSKRGWYAWRGPPKGNVSVILCHSRACVNLDRKTVFKSLFAGVSPFCQINSTFFELCQKTSN